MRTENASNDTPSPPPRKADDWRHRAAEARLWAEKTPDLRARESLLRLAEDFEFLAEFEERRKRLLP